MVGVSDKVRAEVAAVELHAFNNVNFVSDALAFFDGDDAVFTNLHGFGKLGADFAVVIGRDSTDISDGFPVALDLAAGFVQSSADTSDSLVDTAFSDRVNAETALGPSVKIASAKTVAVVVPSPATEPVLLATSTTIFAPMFSYGSRNSISSATVTPSLVT